MEPRRRFLVMMMTVVVAVRPATANSEIGGILHRSIRSVNFPSASNMGIYFALAVPLEDPLKSVALSYFFEANYVVPTNFSTTSYSSFSTSTTTTASTSDDASSPSGQKRTKRSIDRSTIYAVIQNKFESAGFPGHRCLLRSICETSEYPLEHNGVLGDVFRVIFTPSSSRMEDQLPDGVVEAELKGRAGTCSDYHKLCPLALYDLIGILL